MSEIEGTNDVMQILETITQLKSNISNLRQKMKEYDAEGIDQIESIQHEDQEEVNKKMDRIKLELNFILSVEDQDIQFSHPRIIEEFPTLSNRRFSGRRFGLIMTLSKTDYNDGKEIDLTNYEPSSGEEIQLAVSVDKNKQTYLNSAGLKLTLSEPNIENDVFQQFIFGSSTWNTVIDSVQQRGMVFDIANSDNNDPPAKTPVYLFMFHGGHNQRFIYKDNKICAKQNGHAVTFVGGENPFVMMPPSDQLKARQTFTIKLL